MASRRIPLVLLAGRSSEPSTLGPGGGAHHPLPGYKAAEVRVGGRALVELVTERFAGCDRLGPVRVAGPRELYGPLVGDERVVHTDGSLPENLGAAVAGARALADGGPIAIAASDILPDPAELDAWMTEREAGPPCKLWFPLVRARELEGPHEASSWKPKYRIAEEPGGEPVSVLPGHLIVFEPDALRIGFALALMDAVYRTRNLSVSERRGSLVRWRVPKMLRVELAGLARGRAPLYTVRAARRGLGVARSLGRGDLSRIQLERAIAALLVDGTPRDGDARIPLLEGLSLAEDIDTVEEAEAASERA
jgi:hypothetical protein